MKKILSFFIVLLILTNIFPLCALASENNYHRVSIPIFQGNTNNISTEILNGITSDEKENIIFVNVQDFLRISKTELLFEGTDGMLFSKNTVFLGVYYNSSNAGLSLGYSEDEIFKTFKIDVPCIRYNGEIYISLTHGLNAFGINMEIMNKEDILNLISADNKLFNKSTSDNGISILIDKVGFDFVNNPNYLLISSSEPFDKYYTEYKNNYSDYKFSWDTLPWYLNDTTVSAFSFESYYFNDYKGITDFVIGNYDSEKRYYDILLEIINNESDEKSMDIPSIVDLRSEIIDIMSSAEILNDADSFLFSSVNDVFKASERTSQLILCSKFQKNILPNTLLNSDKLKKELIDDKFITDLLKQPIFGRYIIKTYESAIFNNQYALFKSSESVNNAIGEPLKNLKADSFRDIIYNGFTTFVDNKLNEIPGNPTRIPDLLMKNIKYLPGVNSLLSTSEKLGKAKDCYFIQETLKNLCSKSIFEDSNGEYYNTRFILQSSLTAYKLLLNSGVMFDQENKQFIEQKCNKINDMISDLKNCNINFYSNKGVSDKLKNLNKLFTYINTTEPTANYEWHLAPTIEAEDIIVSDDSIYSVFGSLKTSDLVSIIKRNGKYTMIDYIRTFQ